MSWVQSPAPTQGRHYSYTAYRYGFNNQEKDGELGEYYSFAYRVHDARLGRFLSVDPLFRQFSYNSCYAFSENRVIDGFDYEGLEHLNYAARMVDGVIIQVKLSPTNQPAATAQILTCNTIVHRINPQGGQSDNANGNGQPTIGPTLPSMVPPAGGAPGAALVARPLQARINSALQLYQGQIGVGPIIPNRVASVTAATITNPAPGVFQSNEWQLPNQFDLQITIGSVTAAGAANPTPIGVGTGVGVGPGAFAFSAQGIIQNGINLLNLSPNNTTRLLIITNGNAAVDAQVQIEIAQLQAIFPNLIIAHANSAGAGLGNNQVTFVFNPTLNGINGTPGSPAVPAVPAGNGQPQQSAQPAVPANAGLGITGWVTPFPVGNQPIQAAPAAGTPFVPTGGPGT